MDAMDEDSEDCVNPQPKCSFHTSSSFKSQKPIRSILYEEVEKRDPQTINQLEAELNKGFHFMSLDEKQYKGREGMEEDSDSFPHSTVESQPGDNVLKEELRDLSFEAVEEGDVAALQRLTWLGANLNELNNHSDSLIQVAAKKGRFEMLKYLHSQGCHINRDTMYCAVMGGNLDCVRFLIDNGIDPCNQFTGAELLCRAAEEGNVPIIKEFTSRSFNFINARDAYDVTPLFYATEESHMEAVNTLISLGAEIDACILTTMIDENEDMFKHLIKKGGDANVILSISDVGQTPLLFCSLRNNLDMVDFLLEHGADIEAKNERGWTSLHIAAYSNFASLVKKLIDRGAQINSKDVDGLTPLDVAKDKTQPILLENGATSGSQLQ